MKIIEEAKLNFEIVLADEGVVGTKTFTRRFHVSIYALNIVDDIN